MLAFLNNLGLPELLVILVIAVLIFGKDLPQAASKAYLQARKLRNAVDDLRRDSGIDREIRDIERTVREAEWEARRAVAKESLPHVERPRPSAAAAAIPAAASTPPSPPSEPTAAERAAAEPTPTDSAEETPPSAAS